MKARNRRFWLATAMICIASVGCEFAAAPQEKKPNETVSDSVPVQLDTRTEKEVLAQTVTGQEIYMAYCVSCHRADGEGFLGPPTNLKASKLDIAGIREVVQVGRPGKGMMSYQAVLKAAEIDSVVAYVLRFQTSAK
ncbi:MAG: hypothetical protein RLZZ519_1002 [Bacteroidota bacterium]